MSSKLLVIVGPTGSGKTSLSVQIALDHGGSIISADSRQVYRSMDVGTAKAGREILESAPHYLIDARNPDEAMSLLDWQRLSFKYIDQVVTEARLPILTGGTMLYVDSVVKNYDIPEVSPDLRLRRELSDFSTNELWNELIKLDPDARDFVEPHNKQRVVRALEVIRVSGRKFSEARSQRPPRYDVTMFGLFPGWEVLDDRLSRRAQEMLDDGLLEETQDLISKYGHDLSLLKTINYEQARQHLLGKVGRGEMLGDMIRANKRYARRQMSWWKGRDEITWYSSPEEAFKDFCELS